MAKNNQNVGMHYIRRDNREMYDMANDRFGDVLREAHLKKLSEKYEKSSDIDCDSIELTDTKHEAVVCYAGSSAYEDACMDHDQLYANLFLCAIAMQQDLREVTGEVSKELREESGEEIDEVLFLAYASRKIGVSIRQVASLDERDAKRIIWEKIIPRIDERMIFRETRYDDIEVYSTTISFLKSNNVDEVRRYYTFLEWACNNKRFNELPDVFADYMIYFIEEDGKFFIAVSGLFAREDYLYDTMWDIYIGGDPQLDGYIKQLMEKQKNK